MKVFDMDSHLREEYLLDEVYRLEGKFADQSPVSDREKLSEFTVRAPLAGRIEERHVVAAARIAAVGGIDSVSGCWLGSACGDPDD